MILSVKSENIPPEPFRSDNLDYVIIGKHPASPFIAPGGAFKGADQNRHAAI